jgi:hypothetical protein
MAKKKMAIHITESVLRLPLSKKERIDAIRALFKQYGSIKKVCDALDWPRSQVRPYIKHDRRKR